MAPQALGYSVSGFFGGEKLIAAWVFNNNSNNNNNIYNMIEEVEVEEEEALSVSLDYISWCAFCELCHQGRKFHEYL